MNWKKKFMWAASFLVSLFVCGTALAAGNDASADLSLIHIWHDRFSIMPKSIYILLREENSWYEQ